MTDKKVIIMRGISGSGKSTYVKNNFPDATVCSADHYFINENNEYCFDHKKLGQAHKQCQNRFYKAISQNENLIVVDNTNTTIWEMKWYYDLAKNNGYNVFCIRVNTSVENAHKRNSHNVPLDVIESMQKRFVSAPSDWEEIVVSGE
jgi:predicted kinase